MVIEGYDWLEPFLDKLLPAHRYVFEKIFFYNVKNKTIAKNLGLSKQRASFICRQAINNLDKMLRKEGYIIPPRGKGE